MTRTSDVAGRDAFGNLLLSLKGIYRRLGLRRVAPVHGLVRLTGDLALSAWARQRGVFIDSRRSTSLSTKLAFLRGTLDREVIDVCRSLIWPGMTVLDVGAHVGYYTRVFSDAVGPEGSVFAFEPHEANRLLLERNVERLQFANVTVVPMAATDRPGPVSFFEMSSSSSHHSLFDLSKTLDHFQVRNETVVEGIALDRFFEDRGISEIDFVKMDIEGAECSALEGMSGLLAHSRSLALVVELNPGAMRGAGRAPDALIDLLRGFGFQCRIISEDGLLPLSDVEIPTENRSWYANLLCTRGDGRGSAGSDSGALPRP